MRKILPVLVVLILALGAGCARFPEPTPEPPTTEPVSGVFGVIEEINETARTAVLILPDGGQEDLLFPFPIELTEKQAGLLARASGTRELSTRKIIADKIEIVDHPNLFVTSPSPGATVTSPLVVFGFGRAFEQTFEWRVKDESGKEVAESFAMTNAVDIGRFGPFRFEVFLPVLPSQIFTLEVYTAPPRDGREQDLVTMPLRLLSSETTTFNVFFANTRQGSGDDCRLVFPLSRTVAKTSAVGRAALLELLKGPTAAERRQGYFTSLPAGVELRSLVIGNDEARADFSAELNRVGGSCRVISIRSQIEETLRQFPTVGEAVISVEGNVEEALQP